MVKNNLRLVEIFVVNRSDRNVSDTIISWHATNITVVLRKLGVEIPDKFRSLIVVFSNKSDMAYLNKKFRKVDGPTDVLSFEGVEAGSLGEIVLCVDVIKEPFIKEVVFLMLHGILHLLGYEHECGGEKEKIMFDIQKKAFDLILEECPDLNLLF